MLNKNNSHVQESKSVRTESDKKLNWKFYQILKITYSQPQKLKLLNCKKMHFLFMLTGY